MAVEAALCLDVGSRRVGVAASDLLGLTAQPVEVLDRKKLGDTAVLERIVTRIRERGVTAVVVGLPLTFSGTEGAAVQRTRRFLDKLSPRLPATCRIVEWDERLTTVAADRALREGGMRGPERREKVDAVAAALILQGWLEAQRST